VVVLTRLNNSAKTISKSEVSMHPIIDQLLRDKTISEIMVNGTSLIYVERNGMLEQTRLAFDSEGEIMSVINAMLSPLGKAVNNASPYADARLSDGSRVNVIVPPVSLTGPTITIRKFLSQNLTARDLVVKNTASAAMIDFLELCVKTHRNIIVSGGTGSGKTTLLNVMSLFINQSERIITIEDTAELQLTKAHLLRLEAKTTGSMSDISCSIQELLINALRMRPDRIIIGECRGGEALDMLQTMNTGHDGSMTTVHANSARDCLKRLEVMVLMSGLDIPLRAIREQISSAINILVQVSRLSDGSRKIVSINEITGMEGETITLSPIFEFKQTGMNAAGIVGQFSATNYIPNVVALAKGKGLDVNMNMFS
jgi:pilus assembly protein CpaF